MSETADRSRSTSMGVCVWIGHSTDEAGYRAIRVTSVIPLVGNGNGGGLLMRRIRSQPGSTPSTLSLENGSVQELRSPHAGSYLTRGCA